MKQIWDYVVSSGLLLAVIGLVISIARYMKINLDIQTEEKLKNVKNQKIKDAIQKAEDMLWTTVQQIANEIVDNLKEKSTDGKLTKEEIDSVRTEAYIRSKKLMGDDCLELLKDYVGDVSGWMLSKIDAYARQAKIPIAIPTTSTNDNACLDINITPKFTGTLTPATEVLSGTITPIVTENQVQITETITPQNDTDIVSTNNGSSSL